MTGANHVLSTEERFAIKLQPKGDCLEFVGAKARGGYGRFWDGERHVMAHRYAYEAADGPIPDGLWVLHRCDNPPCVNRAHLFLGTAFDNSTDMIAKGRQRWTGARRSYTGEDSHLSKLTWPEVAQIRKDFRAGHSQTSIAKEYGVSFSTIHRIVKPSPSTDGGAWLDDGQRFALAVELGLA